MPSTAESLWDDIRADYSAALQRQGNIIVTEVRNDLSVPVGRDANGRVVVRSKPGEPPRTETGRLRSGLTSDVTTAPESVTLTISDPVPYAVPLQLAMRRIITNRIPTRFGDQVINAVVDAAQHE